MPINIKRFFLTIILPTILTIGLFILLIFRFIIPTFEQNMLGQKKEMIRELVSSSVSIAETFRRQALAGKMSEAEARAAAVLQIQNVRYGAGNKDYCWITDMQPRMVQHPYRPDLNGTDLSGFRDPKGKRLFVEMVRVVEKDGAGYVDYMWQWMDDPSRIVPKISYVRGFKPWGWIIGTGIYIEDIRAEIAGIQKRLLLVLLLISALMALLLTFIIRQHLKAEMKRSAAERDLLESREKYKALVEASTEGTWMILAGATIYANRKMNELLPGVERLAISDDLREAIAPERRDEIRALGEFSRAAATFLRLETRLQAPGRPPVDALLSISKIVLSDKRGYIVIVKELGRRDEAPGIPGRELADIGKIGFFRAAPGKKGRFLDVNDAAMSTLGYDDRTELLAMNIADLVPDRGQWNRLLRELDRRGAVSRFLLPVKTRQGAPRTIQVSARVERDEQGAVMHTDGILEDVTDQESRSRARLELTAGMQALLLKLQQPAALAMRDAVTCLDGTSIRDAAALMTANHTGALLVRSAAGNAVGILTDGDLRRRLVGGGLDPRLPAAAVMSSPLRSVSESTPLFRVWNEMQRAGIGHLAVADADGKVRGMIARSDLDLSLLPPPLGEPQPGTPPLLADLRSRFLKLPELLDVFVGSHARSEWLTGLTTAVADGSAVAAAGIVEIELGPPPAPFAFFVLGSEGRSESTLFTDQDNALVYQDPPDGQEEACRSYFLEFGARLNRLLNQVGYALCPGQVMAGNPRWNQPLSAWQRYFNDWILQPDPQNLLESTTFYDLRLVHGDSGPLLGLQEHIRLTLKLNPAFFAHLARMNLQYKTPLGLFGRIQTDTAEPHHDRVNIKNPLRVIVNLVRLYAMAHGIAETNTLLRLRRLRENGHISSAFFQDLDYAFDFLMSLQFRGQLRSLQAREALGHSLTLDELAAAELQALKTVFSQIQSFPSRLRQDFSVSE